MAVKTMIDPAEFVRDIQIDEHDLNAGMIKQAALFSRYAYQHFEATRQASNKKVALEITEASVAKETRERLTKDNAKVTEKAIEAEVVLDPRYIAAIKDYNDASAMLELAKNSLEAFKQKRDMLIQLGASQREDMKGELRMKSAA